MFPDGKMFSNVAFTLKSSTLIILLMCLAHSLAAQEFRGIWVDAFGPGFWNKEQVVRLAKSVSTQSKLADTIDRPLYGSQCSAKNHFKKEIMENTPIVISDPFMTLTLPFTIGKSGIMSSSG